MVPASLFAIGPMFSLSVPSSNAAMLIGVLLYCWVARIFTVRSRLLSTGLILEVGTMMIYWIAVVSEVDNALEIMMLALSVVLFGGIFWAPVSRWLLAVAERRRDCPICGPVT